MTLTLIGISLSVFVASVVLGMFWYRIRFGIQASKQMLMPETAVVIKTSSGIYRSRFAGDEDRGLRFESLLSRQFFVPIRVGEFVTIETATKRGIVLFRSKVVDRDEATHEIIVERPIAISNIDRRDSKRFACNNSAVVVKLDGAATQLIDVSSKGAKLRAKCEFAKGERVSVELPWQLTEVGAWVIESANLGRGDDACSILRIMFEEPAQLPRKNIFV